MTTASAELLSALMIQKEAVLDAVRKAEGAEDLHKVLDTLQLLEPVWIACGYRYKAAEVRADVRSKAWDLKRAEEDELAGYRKGSGLHNHTLGCIKQLETIIESL